MRNKNQLQSGIKPPRELMLFIWPFIATLLYTLPEFLATTTKKLALQFDGYDNVVHFGILSKILSCESFIDKCQHDSKSPLDSYPQSWHSFFASFSQHYEQKPSELLSLYVLYKASSFLLSLILLSYAIVTIEERRRSDATRFRFISKCLIYIGPLPIYYFVGWPNYTLSISLLVFSYVSFVSTKPTLGLLALSVSGLLYSPFWPLVLIVGLLNLREKSKVKNTFLYFFILVIPAMIFFWDAYNSKLNNYLLVSNSIQLTTVALLSSYAALLFLIWRNKSIENFPLRVYLSAALVIGIPYQIVGIYNGAGGAYFLQKFLGPAPFLIYFGLLMLLDMQSKKFLYFREIKIILYSFLVITLVYWSSPILVSQSARSFISNSELIDKLNSYQYGTRASPLNSAIRNYYVAFDTNSGYAIERANRAGSLLEQFRNGHAVSICFSRVDDAYFYHDSQWLNALNNSWSSSVQSTLDETSRLSLKGKELATFLELSYLKHKNCQGKLRN